MADSQVPALSPIKSPKRQSRTEKTHNAQQTCIFASIQAQLSELQKVLCQLSESVNNVSKNRVEPHTGVCTITLAIPKTPFNS